MENVPASHLLHDQMVYLTVYNWFVLLMKAASMIELYWIEPWGIGYLNRIWAGGIHFFLQKSSLSFHIAHLCASLDTGNYWTRAILYKKWPSRHPIYLQALLQGITPDAPGPSSIWNSYIAGVLAFDCTYATSRSLCTNIWCCRSSAKSSDPSDVQPTNSCRKTFEEEWIAKPFRGFRKWWYPKSIQIIYFNRNFHSKPSTSAKTRKWIEEKTNRVPHPAAL